MVRYSAANSGVSELMRDSGNCSLDVPSHEFEGKVILASGIEHIMLPRMVNFGVPQISS